MLSMRQVPPLPYLIDMLPYQYSTLWDYYYAIDMLSTDYRYVMMLCPSHSAICKVDAIDVLSMLSMNYRNAL